MTARERWDEIRRVFALATECDPAAHDALLAGVDDPVVRDEVRSLLAQHAVQTDFLERPAIADFAFAGPPDLTGQTLGAWRIVEQIGRGGMGIVYRAVRADQAFHREAALKVIGRTPSPAIIERFRQERETLARLDHPAIARLLDGGATAAGHPYYVMELVTGTPVDRYCDDRRLDVAARLALFRRVCEGVQSAHEALVIHRDLKPANILIQADGQPKLLDFGIAKLISAAALPDPLARSTWALTPEYASPEQLRGGLVSTASDVYALGVLLHLLLTGLTPSTATSGVFPARPASACVSGDHADARAAARGTTPHRLAAALTGDLDAIVARALAADVAHRYTTVAQLVQDLERYRRSEPVSARPRTSWYVVRRFVERHRVGVALTCAVLLAGAIAVTEIVRQSRLAAAARSRAERRFDDLRALTRTFMFDVDAAIVNLPGATEARALMVRTALQYLERLAAESSQDASLQRELASGFLKVGDAQGHPTSPNLGDTAGAQRSYERAITIGQALVDADPDDVEAARTLAQARRRLGDVLAWMGAPDRALVHVEQSARECALVAARPDATSEDRLQGAVALIKLGDLLGNPNLPNLGRREQALQRFGEARAALLPLAAAAPHDARVQRYVGILFERLGTMHEQAGRTEAAAAAYRDSFTIRRQLAEAQPLHVDMQRDLAIAYEKLANVERSAGRHEAAVQAYRGALDRFVRLARLDPENAIAARSVAIAPLQASLATHRRLADADRQSAQAACDAVRVSQRYAEVIGAGRPTREACIAWRESHRLRRTRAAAACAPPDEARIVSRLATCDVAPAR